MKVWRSFAVGLVLALVVITGLPLINPVPVSASDTNGDGCPGQLIRGGSGEQGAPTDESKCYARITGSSGGAVTWRESNTAPASNVAPPSQTDQQSDVTACPTGSFQGYSGNPIPGATDPRTCYKAGQNGTATPVARLTVAAAAAATAEREAAQGNNTTCENGKNPDGSCITDDTDALGDCGGEGFNWIVCPFIDLAQKGIEKIDGFIMSSLEFDVTGVFDTTCADPNKPCTGKAYYTAWNSFRIIATAIIVIAGLFMVISQALGFDFLDAYTVRKVLPRLVVAVIGISLSWPLMAFIVEFFNVLGTDIRSLIYAPFRNLGGGIDISVGIASSLAVIGVGFTLTAFGSLSLIITALLAVLVGFVIIVIRQLALVMIIIVAPVAIACYILPNTEKVWKLWKDNFLGLLLMFPIISGLIAAGHVFSAVALADNAGGEATGANLVAQVVGVVAYFLPYFLLPLTFRLATGFIGTIAGFTNDRGRGVFDRLKKSRANGAAQKHQRRMAGQTAFGSSRAGSLYRRGASLSDPNSGAGSLLTASGRAKFREYERKHLAHASEEMLKNDNGRWSGDDDANFLAAKGHSRDQFLQEYAARVYGDGSNGVTQKEAMQRARASLGGLESSYGAKMGSEAMRVTAYKAWNGSTTGAALGEDGWKERRELGGEMVKEGLMTASDAAGAIKGNAKRADGSGASYGQMIQFLDAAAKGGYARNDKGVIMNEEYMLRNASHGAGPSEALGGHTNTLKSFAPLAYKDFVAAASNPDEQIKLAAEIDGRYNALSQVNKDKADIWGDQVMSQPSGHMGKDKDGNDVELNMQQYVTSLRSDPTFQTRSRQYEQQAVMGMNAFAQKEAMDAQARIMQQMMQQRGPGPGGLGGLGGPSV